MMMNMNMKKSGGGLIMCDHNHLNPHFLHSTTSSPSFFPFSSSSSSSSSSSITTNLHFLPHHKLSIPHFSFATGDGDGVNNGDGGVNNGGGGGGDPSPSSSSDGDGDGDGDGGWLGILVGIFLSGWGSRVAADPQFPFKVLMEELVGVSSCVLGDMASRPHFGLHELDFVFSTLIVGAIVNFTLMYLLAPTSSPSFSTLPSFFSSCPTSHMFQPGSFTLLHRLGTFVYKGAIFAAVGFAAGLVGTSISNSLISLRKKMDPTIDTPNKAPPTVLNALTWAIHMGFSSNFRYQTLNGIEFLLEKGVPPLAFKTSVVVLRCLNNILGGMSFVILARITGSQSIEEPAAMPTTNMDKDKLLDEGDDLQAKY